MKAGILITLFTVAIIFNLVTLYMHDFSWKTHWVNYAGILSLSFLITAQIMGISHRKKIAREKEQA